MKFEPVIGLEVHVELATKSKMFCGCPVVDSIESEPNTAVCPVCSGMPGALPVVNERAVEYAMRVGLALGCKIEPVSIFARKNYFYPDLPKGYQISQFEEPLATNGEILIETDDGEKVIRVLRAHLEEDASSISTALACPCSKSSLSPICTPPPKPAPMPKICAISCAISASTPVIWRRASSALKRIHPCAPSARPSWGRVPKSKI